MTYLLSASQNIYKHTSSHQAHNNPASRREMLQTHIENHLSLILLYFVFFFLHFFGTLSLHFLFLCLLCCCINDKISGTSRYFPHVNIPIARKKWTERRRHSHSLVLYIVYLQKHRSSFTRHIIPLSSLRLTHSNDTTRKKMLHNFR